MELPDEIKDFIRLSASDPDQATILAMDILANSGPKIAHEADKLKKIHPEMDPFMQEVIHYLQILYMLTATLINSGLPVHVRIQRAEEEIEMHEKETKE